MCVCVYITGQNENVELMNQKSTLHSWKRMCGFWKPSWFRRYSCVKNFSRAAIFKCSLFFADKGKKDQCFNFCFLSQQLFECCWDKKHIPPVFKILSNSIKFWIWRSNVVSCSPPPSDEQEGLLDWYCVSFKNYQTSSSFQVGGKSYKNVWVYVSKHNTNSIRDDENRFLAYES